MGIIIRIVLVAVGLLVAGAIVPGVLIEDFWIALIAAVVLGLLHLIVRPILVILTLPVTIVTFGLFLFVINALLFITAAAVVDGFSVEGFWAALLGSIIVSIAGIIADALS